MSIIIIILIVCEIVRFLHEENIFTLYGLYDLGTVLHSIAMVLFFVNVLDQVLLFRAVAR